MKQTTSSVLDETYVTPMDKRPLSKGKVIALLVVTTLVTVYYSKKIETTVKRFNNQSELYNR